jgi:hypothetical protein
MWCQSGEIHTDRCLIPASLRLTADEIFDRFTPIRPTPLSPSRVARARDASLADVDDQDLTGQPPSRRIFAVAGTCPGSRIRFAPHWISRWACEGWHAYDYMPGIVGMGSMLGVRAIPSAIAKNI